MFQTSEAVTSIRFFYDIMYSVFIGSTIESKRLSGKVVRECGELFFGEQ